MNKKILIGTTSVVLLSAAVLLMKRGGTLAATDSKESIPSAEMSAIEAPVEIASTASLVNRGEADNAEPQARRSGRTPAEELHGQGAFQSTETDGMLSNTDVPSTRKDATTTLVIESRDPQIGVLEIEVPATAKLPFTLVEEPSQDMPAPVRAAYDDIARDFADSLAASALASIEAENVDSSTGSDESPATLNPAALQRATNAADQRYRALFGNAAYNRAGIQRALQTMQDQAEK